MNNKCRVAILVCLQDQMHNTIGYSLFKKLRLPTITGLHYAPVIIPVEFTEQALRAKMSLTVQGNYDVIVVIGDFFSKILALMYNEIIPIPTVFIGASDPVKLGLVASLDCPGGFMSGVIARSQEAHLSYAKKILLFKHYVRRILIPYKPDEASGTVGRGALACAEYLRTQGCEVILVEAFSEKAIMEAVHLNLNLVDAIWLLEACLSGSLIRPIAHECWRQDKILFSSSSRGGIDLGATCSYGIDLEEFADVAGYMVRQYWEKRVSFAVQPVVELAGIRRLYLNKALFAQSGLPSHYIDVIGEANEAEVLKIWVNCPI